MTGRDRDEDADNQAPPVPWHNRTSTVLGVSVAGLIAIAILVASVNYLVGRLTEPQQAPINYVGPASPAVTTTRSSAPSTTATITTTTRPPVTSDINPDETSTSSEAPDASSLNPETTTRNPNYRPPRTRDNDSSGEPTTRSRPRANGTRTLSPAP